MLRTESPAAWLFGDEPSSCNLIRRCNSDIENTGAAGHDVNGIKSLGHAVQNCGQGATQRQSMPKYSGRSFAQKKRFRMTCPI
jgi:hypothetical protein